MHLANSSATFNNFVLFQVWLNFIFFFFSKRVLRYMLHKRALAQSKLMAVIHDWNCSDCSIYKHELSIIAVVIIVISNDWVRIYKIEKRNKYWYALIQFKVYYHEYKLHWFVCAFNETASDCSISNDVGASSSISSNCCWFFVAVVTVLQV